MAVNTKQLHDVAAKQPYDSRLEVVVCKELSDIILSKPALRGFLKAALLVIPIAIVFVQAISGSHNDLFSNAPTFLDNDIRTTFPNIIWIAAVFLSGMAGLFINQIEPVGTLEPLLVTSVRRWEIVAGKLIAFGIAWFGFAVIQAMILAIIPYIPALVAASPFLSYFHPTATFFAEFVLVFTFGGVSAYAAFLYMLLCPRPVTSILIIIVACIGSLAGQYVTTPWPLLGFIPLMNLSNGLSAVFAGLPYDPRVQNPSPHFGASYDHPGFWIVCVAGGIITSLILGALTVRNLRAGMPLPDTAK